MCISRNRSVTVEWTISRKEWLLYTWASRSGGAWNRTHTVATIFRHSLIYLKITTLWHSTGWLFYDRHTAINVSLIGRVKAFMRQIDNTPITHIVSKFGRVRTRISNVWSIKLRVSSFDWLISYTETCVWLSWFQDNQAWHSTKLFTYISLYFCWSAIRWIKKLFSSSWLHSWCGPIGKNAVWMASQAKCRWRRLCK